MSLPDLYQTMEYGPAPESDAVAHEWLDGHGRRFDHFIGGRWRKGGSHFETLCPATGRPIARVAHGTATDVDAAVKAARKAQPAWAALPGAERARHLYALARHVQRHSRLFAVVESLDNGKPIRETRDIDIPLVARHFYHHAGWASLVESEFAGYGPIGVAGQIIPWNFPLLMLAWKIAPALACGNTVVLKPAEFTPLTALLFAEACMQVGLPAGVVNIVTGDGTTGAAIVDHPGIDKIAFTGSTDVGRIIREKTAGSGKKLSLELGGKSPFLVFDDADQDSAIEGLVDAIWFNQGQVCCAGSRLLVQESIAERFLAKLRRRMESLRVGDPLDKAIDIGAIVAPVQLQRISDLVEQGVSEGAHLFQPSWSCPQEGWFYPPTLLTHVGPASTVAQVEIFGPVLVAMTFRTPTEAVALANNTPYGLAASVWSENLGLALDVAGRIKAGTVWVNCTNQFDANSGFGGYRESGYGREGGIEGLYEYLRPNRIASAGSARSKDAPRPVESHGLDRTHKQFIGGKQVRPDSGYSLRWETEGREPIEVARGNRKDVRNAVQAARQAQDAWAGTTAHGRAQVLYYLAENLAAARSELLRWVGEDEFEASVERAMVYAAWADKYDGRVHTAPWRGVVYTLNEPIGVVGIVCPPERPLLALLSLALPAVAMGNAVVVLPSEPEPGPAVELYRILDYSDVPGGVFNLLTGLHAEMAPTLAGHDDVDAIWHFGDPEGAKEAERLSIGNLKQTWTATRSIEWETFVGPEILRRSTQVKNVWVPVGE